MEIMTPGQTKEARRILVFNPLKKFIGVFSSQLQAARILGVRTPTVKAACDGDAISTCSLYLRWWDPKIEIDVDEELGVLTLKEYDQLCDVHRKVYKNGRMNRENWKYNMKATPEKLKSKKKRDENNQSEGNQPIQ